MRSEDYGYEAEGRLGMRLYDRMGMRLYDRMGMRLEHGMEI